MKADTDQYHDIMVLILILIKLNNMALINSLTPIQGEGYGGGGGGVSGEGLPGVVLIEL